MNIYRGCVDENTDIYEERHRKSINAGSGKQNHREGIQGVWPGPGRYAGKELSLFQ
jgi:hypothetical protein